MAMTQGRRTAALAGVITLTSLDGALLFKHGSQLIFGVQARQWGFGFLAVSVLLLGFVVATMVTSQKPKP